ncbi:hypothetical protein GOP47_0007448 [Adiantum capillus-veneris]|uniref:PPIase cyclophilin-type domain-containing protein n=1 Tax=Adiantum capillus-veneris TaxID=13818 RepID=A0A9D4V0W1_ADICA|nr:hypothetical protein GOP47_0007448 [Adiantum capillus-veneris]
MAVACPFVAVVIFSLACRAVSEELELGSLRVVFQTKYGDIEFGFAKHVAPVTVDHITKLVKLGAYNTNHFFRVDRGFVAQVADVVGGREAPLNAEQRKEGEKTVIGEFSNVKHTKGILSMGRHSDPDSAGSSFSILLGNAPHLDGQYAIFGKVTKGYETLAELEELPTKREGIFVMPLERITILSTYYYDSPRRGSSELGCEEELVLLKKRLIELADQNQGTYKSLMLGMALGCAILLAVAWQRGWWRDLSKPKRVPKLRSSGHYDHQRSE